MEARRIATDRREGNVLIVSLIFITFLGGLTMAHVMVVQSNTRQSAFFQSYNDLKSYADSGVHLSLHDLRHGVTANDGRIGTTAWTAVDDLGVDGTASTYDEGEADGVPTPGEPNVAAVSVGATAENIGLVVYTEDSPWPDVKRIVSTAIRGEAMSIVEVYANAGGTATVPKVSAVYVDPDVALDLKGNSFLIDGNDTNPDGTPGPGPAVFGLATAEDSSNPGDNAQNLIDQISSSRYDQVIGQGGNPSVGESPTAIDLDATFNAFKAIRDRDVSSGTHSGVTWGSSGNYEITYVDGDLHLSGNGSGAGVLLVEGNLTMSGQFTWEGMVMVLGDMRQTGGGSGVHVYGTIMVGSTITVVDEVTVTGNADLFYSSVALAGVESMAASAGAPYNVLYWNVLK